jgi:hypothetical protein
MPCIRFCSALMAILLGAVLPLAHHRGFAQANGAKASPWAVAMPVSLEWSESFHPFAEDRFAADGFKFRGGTKNLKMQFSTQAPAILGGKQFSWMPGGYQLAEFSLTRKWGSIQGFRSLRHNTRMVRPDLTRTITGAGLEAPKSILGTDVTAYFLQAMPTSETREAQGQSMAGASGMQAGLTLSRNFRKNARMQAEWTQSWHELQLPDSIQRAKFFGGARRAFMLGFEGTLARIELSTALISREEGLLNPAAPAYGPGTQNIRLNARRRFKGHQFQYGTQADDQGASSILGQASHNLMEQSAGWSYAKKRFPQIAASQTLKRETVQGRHEEERELRLSLAKPLRRIDARLAFVRAMRADLLASRPLWDRLTFSGDATIEIRKGRRLHLQYEANTLEQRTLAQKISSSVLQADTRFALWGEKITLVPTAEFRRQVGSLPAHDMSAARLALAAQIKMPRRIPGTDFLINFASNHVQAPGRPDWNRTDLTLRWNFKRF